jgi:hypothetical protein
MTTLTSPHDLLAAIPFLIGYHPSNSLVLVALSSDSDDRGSVGMAMRVDLPVDIAAEGYDLLAAHLTREKADAALLVAYTPKGCEDGEVILISASAALMRAGIEIKESLVVQNNRFRSLLCIDSLCCPPQGSPVPEIDSSRIAAEHVIAGHLMPFASVNQLIESISTLPTSTAEDWCSEVNQFFVAPDAKEINNLQRDGATAVIDLAGEYQAGRGAEDSELAARVIGRMSDIQVRDFALGSHSPETADFYWTMWRDLLVIAPLGYVAPIASVFAAIAYERGEGALAHKALDRAVADDPRYSLALLLRRVFTAGWPAQSFTTMRMDLHPKVVAAIFG